MSAENIKEEILGSKHFDYLKSLPSPCTPLTSKIPISQIRIKIPSLSHTQPFTISIQSPLPQTTPNMESQPPNRMDAIVVARYDNLVLLQPQNTLPGGDYQKYLPIFNGQGEVTT